MKLQVSFVATALFMASIVQGCGSDSDANAPVGAGGQDASTSGGAAGSSAGTAGNAGQAGGAAGAGAAGADGGVAGNAGSPWVEEACEDAATNPPVIAWTNGAEDGSNGLFMNQLTSEQRRCQRVSVTPHCTIYDCLTAHFTGAAAEVKGPSAGTFKIHSSDGLQDVELQPSGTGIYDVYSSNTGRWKPGDALTFSATGAEIPAFSFDMISPAPLQLLEPSLDAGKPQVDPTKPFTVKWTPTDGDVMLTMMHVEAGTDPLNRTEGWCYFKGDTGQGELPVEMLQRFSQDSGTLTSAIGALHASRKCYAGIPGRQLLLQTNYEHHFFVTML